MALGWELWRRRRARLLTIAACIVAFATLYPKLCLWAGADPSQANFSDQIVRKFVDRQLNTPPFMQVLQFLCGLFLAGGPAAVMVLTLLCLAWMFSFAEFDPQARELVAFSTRQFNLPLRNGYLFWWFWLTGMGILVAVCEAWNHFVPFPAVGEMMGYRDVLTWMTLLALAQAVILCLSGWPITRTLLLIGILWGFLFSIPNPVYQSPGVLLPLLGAGTFMARLGLKKCRHGEWRDKPWSWQLKGRGPLPGPSRFSSPESAQLWFEWQRFGRKPFWLTASLTLPFVILSLLAKSIFGWGPLQNETETLFIGYLGLIPLFIHLCFGSSPGLNDFPFVLNRPLRSGQIVMALLKAEAIGALLTWGVVLIAIGLTPLLGNFIAAEHAINPAPQGRILLVIVLIFLTWRVVVANLCFSLVGNKFVAAIPTLFLIPTFILVTGVVNAGAESNNQAILHYAPGALGGILAAKLLLASISFGASLKRGLLSAKSALGYVAAWALLSAGLIVAMLALAHPPKDLAWPLALAAVALTPLARIGAAPLTLAWTRHR